MKVVLSFKVHFILIITFFINYAICHSKEANEIFNYFESFKSFTADFLQVNNNGNILSGKILLKKPGKIRIEYDESPLLIVGDGKKLATINKKLGTIGFFNIKDIPIKILLYEKIDKTRVKLLDLKEQDNIITVKVKESILGSDGALEITFEKRPFRIVKWTVLNSNKTKTEILLSKIKYDISIENTKFDLDLVDPRIPFWKN